MPRQRAGRSLRRRTPFPTLLAVALVAPVAASAQDRPPDDDRERERVFSGVVVDELTGSPIRGAVVAFDGHRPAAVTDSLGRFTLRGFDGGEQVLLVRQFGYMTIRAAVVPPRFDDVRIRIPLAAEPIQLEGVLAAVDRVAEAERRMESRRRAVAVSSRVIDQERLVTSGAGSMVDFLIRQPMLHPTPCGRWRMGWCFFRRGRTFTPTVWIDEMPAMGGLEQLHTYNPQDFYRVEIYSGGVQIRAYTHTFMSRLARRPRALIPIFH